MAKTKKKPVKETPVKVYKSSGARLIEAGLRPVQLWLTEEQYERLSLVAKTETRQMTKTLIHHVFPVIDRLYCKYSEKSV